MSYYSPVPPIISVQEFFHDDSKTSWKPLPEHDLKQSKSLLFYYRCKDIENVYLETIEHHCKYSNPEVHKLEILKKLSLKEKKRVSQT